jgi:hypothetical protein
MMKYPRQVAVGWTAITSGVITAITPTWATTTPAGAGFTLGLGAMTVIYGVWSLVARDPTRDHWALSVVGLVLGMSPWVGGYAGDGAAWVAWIGGLALLAVGGTAYIADEAANVSETVRVKALATYQLQHGWTPPDGLPAPRAHRWEGPRTARSSDKANHTDSSVAPGS